MVPTANDQSLRCSGQSCTETKAVNSLRLPVALFRFLIFHIPKSSSRYQSLQEVLKLSAPFDVLTYFCQVNRRWLTACQLPSLWVSFGEERGFSRSSKERNKEWYRAEVRSRLRIPVIKKTQVAVFDVVETTWKQFSLSANEMDLLVSNHFCTPLLLPDDSLLCCGDDLVVGNGTKTVLRIYANCIESLSDMYFPRGDVNAVIFSDEIFVFGGAALVVQSDLLAVREDYEEEDYGVAVWKTSESLRLSPKFEPWKRIPNMTKGRLNSGTCVLYQEIYICGGSSSPSIEIYSPEKQSFRLTRLQLPRCISTAFREKWTASVYGNTIIILSATWTSFLDLPKGTLRSVTTHPLVPTRSANCPYLHGFLYFPSIDGNVCQQSICTSAIEKIYTFPASN